MALDVLFLSIILAGIVPAVTMVIVLLFTKSERDLGVFITPIIALILGTIANYMIIGIGHPAFYGVWWGYGVFMVTMVGQVIVMCLCAFASENDQWKIFFGSLIIGGVILVAGFGGVIFTSLKNTWGSDQATHLAALANIKVEQKSFDIPEPDPQHVPILPQDAAGYKATQALGSTGQNLGSQYQIDNSQCVLQVIRKKMTWACPLTWNSNNSFGSTWNGDVIAGYILVNAEDQTAIPEVHVAANDHLRCYAGARNELDPQNLAYWYNGYRSANLVDVTLEIPDDPNDNPYWTIGEVSDKYSVDGPVVNKILLINATTCAITEKNVNDVPSWVDRIWDKDTVQSLVNLWGGYHFDNSWPNRGHQNQQQVAGDPQLTYSKDGKEQWELLMTSYSSNDQSSLGVVLFDTRDNNGHYIPLSGMGLGDNVQAAFQKAPQNLRNFDVENVQLYQIDGTPTYVCSYTTSGGTGGTVVQAVGLMPAYSVQGSSVTMTSDYPSALLQYGQYLVIHAQPQQKVTGTSNFPKVNGRIQSVKQVDISGTTQYEIQIKGDAHIWVLSIKVSELAPFVQTDDQVSFSYAESGTRIENVLIFDDYRLDQEFPTTPRK